MFDLHAPVPRELRQHDELASRPLPEFILPKPSALGYHRIVYSHFMKPDFKRPLRAAGVVLVCALAAANSGCSKPPVFHIIAHPPDYYPSQQYKVLVGGRELGGGAGKQTLEFDATGRPGESSKEMLPDNIEVRMPFVCGWEKTTFSLVEPNFDQMQNALKQHRAAEAHLWIYDLPSTPSEVFIYVDNRNGPALTLSVGELQSPVAAGAVDHVFFPYSPTCEQAKQLRMNGNLLGPIQEKTGSPGTALPMVLDTSSSRCYREEWANYDRQPSFSNLPPGGRGKTIYRPRPLLTLPEKPDLFLMPLPNVVMTSDPVASKSALEEVPCRPGKL